MSVLEVEIESEYDAQRLFDDCLEEICAEQQQEEATRPLHHQTRSEAQLLSLCQRSSTSVCIARCLAGKKTADLLSTALNLSRAPIVVLQAITAAAEGTPVCRDNLFRAVWQSSLRYIRRNGDEYIKATAIETVSALAAADAALACSVDDVARLLDCLPEADDDDEEMEGNEQGELVETECESAALEAISLMARFPHISSSLAKEAGGLQALKAMLEPHRRSDMQMRAAQAVFELGQIAECRHQVVESGLAEALAAIVTRRDGHRDPEKHLQYKAFAGIASLAPSASFANAFSEGGECEESILEMARAAHHNSEVGTWVGAALCGILNSTGRRAQQRAARMMVERHLPSISSLVSSIEPVAEAMLLLVEILGRTPQLLDSLKKHHVLAGLMLLSQSNAIQKRIGEGVWWGGVGTSSIGRGRLLGALEELQTGGQVLDETVIRLLAELSRGAESSYETRIKAGRMLKAGILKGIPEGCVSSIWSACLGLLRLSRVGVSHEEFKESSILAGEAAETIVNAGYSLGIGGIEVILAMCTSSIEPAGESEADRCLHGLGLTLGLRRVEEIAPLDEPALRLFKVLLEGLEDATLPDPEEAVRLAEALLRARLESCASNSIPGAESYLVRLTLMGSVDASVGALEAILKHGDEASARLVESEGLRWIVSATEMVGVERGSEILGSATDNEEKLLGILESNAVRDLIEICASEECRRVPGGPAEVAMNAMLKMASDDEMVGMLSSQAKEAGLESLLGKVENVAVLLYKLEDVEAHILGESRLSRIHKGSGLVIKGDLVKHQGEALNIEEGCLTPRSPRGGTFHSVRATHGCGHGKWAYQVEVVSLPPGAHMRVGWGTAQACLHEAVGFDAFGVGYQERGGRLFQARVGWPYGTSFQEGDIIRTVLTKPHLKKEAECLKKEEESSMTSYDAASIHFFLNGVDQGDALSVGDITEPPVNIDLMTDHYPYISLYGGAEVRVRLSTSVCDEGGAVDSDVPSEYCVVQGGSDINDDVSISLETEVIGRNLACDDVAISLETEVIGRNLACAAIESVIATFKENHLATRDLVEDLVCAAFDDAVTCVIKLASSRIEEKVDVPPSKSDDDRMHQIMRVVLPLCDVFLQESVDELAEDLIYDVMMAALEDEQEANEQPGNPVAPDLESPTARLSKETFSIYENQGLLVERGILEPGDLLHSVKKVVSATGHLSSTNLAFLTHIGNKRVPPLIPSRAGTISASSDEFPSAIDMMHSELISEDASLMTDIIGLRSHDNGIVSLSETVDTGTDCAELD